MYYNKNKICVFNIPINELHPHPSNPRKDLGDLSELVESIRTVGIKQNLTVVPDRDADGNEIESSYTVIIGHRRLAAAKEAGFSEVPCAIDTDITPAEQIALMLHENMQRRQLTPQEEGLGFQQLQLEFGWSVGKISTHSGFSETTVRDRLRVAQFDKAKVKKAYEERQPKLVEFEALSKVQNEEKRNELLEYIGTTGFIIKVQNAIEQEFEDAFMKEIQTIPQLANATIIPTYDAWNSGKYKLLTSVKAPDNGKIDDNFIASLPTIPEGQKRHYIYYKTYQKELNFYTKVKSVAKEQTKADLERRENIAKAWADLQELGRKYYEQRKHFVEQLPFSVRSNERKLLVLQGALFAGMAQETRYQDGSVRNTMESILEIPPAKGYQTDVERRILLVSKLQTAKPGKWPLLVYQLFADSDSVIEYGWNTKNWPEDEKSVNKTALYTWLESLGYETSDEERELLEGSHEIFWRGENK